MNLRLEPSSKHINMFLFYFIVKTLSRVTFPKCHSHIEEGQPPFHPYQHGNLGINYLKFASLIKSPKPSTTIIKRNGASESSYLRSLCWINSFIRLTLTSTEIWVDTRHCFIHPIHFSPKPSLRSIYIYIYVYNIQHTESFHNQPWTLGISSYTSLLPLPFHLQQAH